MLNNDVLRHCADSPTHVHEMNGEAGPSGRNPTAGTDADGAQTVRLSGGS